MKVTAVAALALICMPLMAKKKGPDLQLRVVGYYTPERQQSMERVFVMDSSDNRRYVLACSLKTQPPCAFLELGTTLEGWRDRNGIRTKYRDRSGQEHKQEFDILRVRSDQPEEQ